MFHIKKLKAERYYLHNHFLLLLVIEFLFLLDTRDIMENLLFNILEAKYHTFCTIYHFIIIMTTKKFKKMIKNAFKIIVIFLCI